jgi:hypothetical protein
MRERERERDTADILHAILVLMRMCLLVEEILL